MTPRVIFAVAMATSACASATTAAESPAAQPVGATPPAKVAAATPTTAPPTAMAPVPTAPESVPTATAVIALAEPTPAPTVAAADVAVEPSPLDVALGIPTDPFGISRAYKESNDAYADLVDSCVHEGGYPEFRESRYAAPDPFALAAAMGAPEIDQLFTTGYGGSISLKRLVAPHSVVDSTSGVAAGDVLSNYVRVGMELDPDDYLAYRRTVDSCRDVANRQVPEWDYVPADLLGELSALLDERQNDEVTADIWAEWRGCMSEQGVEGYTSSGDISQRLSRRSADLVTEIQQLLSDGTIDSAVGPVGSQLSGVMWDHIAELFDTEGRLLEADVGCQQALNTWVRIRNRQWELEREFVDEHAERITAIRAAREGD